MIHVFVFSNVPTQEIPRHTENKQPRLTGIPSGPSSIKRLHLTLERKFNPRGNRQLRTQLGPVTVQPPVEPYCGSRYPNSL